MARYDAVIVAPNSAVDSYYTVDRLAVGEVSKAGAARHTAGGKGINAGRALRNLGGWPLCVGLAAGHAGRFIVDELDREGIGHDLTWTAGETRRNCTLYVPGSPDTTGVLENGPQVTPETRADLTAAILAHALDAPFVALAGSLPPGFGDAYYAELVRGLHGQGAAIAVDCAGAALRLAAEAGPTLLKVNRREFAGAFLDGDVTYPPAAAGRAYAALHARGLELLVITDGPRGSDVYYGDPAGRACLHACTPAQAIVSSAGSGDAYLAGLLLALGRGEPLAEAVKFASAAAAANLLALGCGVLDLGQVQAFLPGTSVATGTWS